MPAQAEPVLARHHDVGDRRDRRRGPPAGRELRPRWAAAFTRNWLFSKYLTQRLPDGGLVFDDQQALAHGSIGISRIRPQPAASDPPDATGHSFTTGELSGAGRGRRVEHARLDQSDGLSAWSSAMVTVPSLPAPARLKASRPARQNPANVTLPPASASLTTRARRGPGAGRCARTWRRKGRHRPSSTSTRDRHVRAVPARRRDQVRATGNTRSGRSGRSCRYRAP